MSVKESFELACPKCQDDSQLLVTFSGTCKLTADGSEDVGDHEWNEHSWCVCGACGHEATVAGFNVPSTATLDMGNITDAHTEWLLAYVRGIARMTPSTEGAYDDATATIDALIANARKLLAVPS